MKKFKSLASTPLKKFTVILTISVLSVSVLCSCSNNTSTEIEDTDIETEATTEKTEESTAVTEEPTTEETIEESTDATLSEDETTANSIETIDMTDEFTTAEATTTDADEADTTDADEADVDEADTTVNLPSDEYLVDCPLTLGDQKVYFKYPADVCTSVEKLHSECDDLDYIYCILGESYNFIYYTINGPFTLDYYTDCANNDTDSTYVFSEENCDNGITIYKIDITGEYDTYTEYIIEYYIDDTNYLVINIHEYPFEDAHEAVEAAVDFYRNVENLVIVQ